MLKVSTKKKQEPLRLDLGGGSALLLRKADSFDQIAAESEAVRIVAAIEAGEKALAAYLLGEQEAGSEEEPGTTRDPGALLAVITEIELAMRVVSGVENIELDETLQTQPSRRLFAALFCEVYVLNAFRAKSRGDLHVRTALGNGSAPSPTGGPPAASPIADPATASEPPALEASKARPESAAPSESTAS